MRPSKSTMLENFKSMPVFLKFLTGHALFCIILSVVVLIPRDHFGVGTRQVTYSEWITSGIGPLLAFIGLAMATAGLLFLKRNGIGRYIHLACFGGMLTVPRVITDEYRAAALGLIFALVLGAYLFGNKRVREYFASNNSFKPKPLRGSA